MEKKDVIEFFDKYAPYWDKNQVRNEDIISSIMTLADIRAGIDVLDVACGTGVLLGDYLKRNVKSVTAIDISPKMAEIARSKYPEVNVICGDVESACFDKQFDVVMVYDAFPHFPNPTKLIETLASHVKKGGRLSVAHSMSREALREHHKGAEKVSIDLVSAQELAQIFSPYFDVDVIISTDKTYHVSGVRKN